MITILVLLGIAAVALVVYWLAQSETFTIFVGGFLVGAVFVFFFTAILSWPVMLLIGAAHSHYAGIPALGFWATFFSVAALRLATLQLWEK